MYPEGQDTLPAILLDPSVEEAIRKAIQQTSTDALLALDPDTTQQSLHAMAESVGEYTTDTWKLVLMAPTDVWRHVYRLIEGEHYGLSVVSYREVTLEILV